MLKMMESLPMKYFLQEQAEPQAHSTSKQTEHRVTAFKPCLSQSKGQAGIFNPVKRMVWSKSVGWALPPNSLKPDMQFSIPHQLYPLYYPTVKLSSRSQ